MRAEIIKAAELMSREDHYEFMKVDKPTDCKDSACALGWVAFTMGLEDNVEPGMTMLNQAAAKLGFQHQIDFYDYAINKTYEKDVSYISPSQMAEVVLEAEAQQDV